MRSLRPWALSLSLCMLACGCAGPLAALWPAPAKAMPPTLAAPDAAPAKAAPALDDPVDERLPPIVPRAGRVRPLVAIIGENYYTELTDYVVPYGVLAASNSVDVMALGLREGPIRMFPAPMNVLPQATAAEFDARHPDGADVVIVPAVHRDEEPALLEWVRAQARMGARIVGICDGVLVVANSGLLENRRATGHWFSMDKLRKGHPRTTWIRDRRYVADGNVVTTTGVTASLPVSLALVEAVAGTARAQAVATQLGLAREAWSARHDGTRFRLDWGHRWTIARNFVSLWSHEQLAIDLQPGIDEISLALWAEVYSATFRSTAYTVAASSAPVRTRRGLLVVPDRLQADATSLRRLPAPSATEPARALDLALRGVERDYGRDTAAWVATQMEYPGY